MTCIRAAKLLTIALIAVSAPAEVVDSSAGGFTSKVTLNVAGTPESVFRQLLRIGDWWDPEHTYSRDSKNLSIEEKAGGCFCEKLPNGGAVHHMDIVLLIPGKTVRLLGALGPLQSMAVTGSLSIDLSPAEGGAKLQATYTVGGYLPAGLNTLAAPVDSVVTMQFTRFKNYVEHHDPTWKADR